MLFLISLAVLGQNGTATDPEVLKRTIAAETATVESSPDDTDALYRLGLAYLSLGQPKKAISSLEVLIKKDPESLDGKLLLARAYRLAGETGKAKVLLDTTILSLPEEPSLRAERALLARSLDEISDALLHLKKAVELSPDNPELLFNLAEAQQQNGKLDEAIANYKRAIEINSDLTVARVNLGKALAEKGRFGEAKEVLGAVTKAGAIGDAEAFYNLGVIHMREGAVTEAVMSFERVLQANPKHAQALNNLGVAWDARGDAKKALDYFKRATLADPTFAEPFFNQGLALMKLNKSAEATKSFEQALKLEPGSSSPYVQLGTLYLKQGKRDRAVEAFKRALELIDDEEKKSSGFLQLKKRFNVARNSDAYRGLAMAYLGLGKVDEAIATLKRGVEKMPKDAAGRAALGEAYLAQGNADGAVEQFQVRLELEPTVDAKLDLARAYVKKRVQKSAVRLLQEVMTEEPANRQAKMGLADLYIAMGSYSEAEILLRNAIATDSNDAQAQMRLGIMKARMGRPNEAIEPLEKAVQLNPSLTDARAELAFLWFRGDPANADRCVVTMRDILTADPRNAIALDYLGSCLYTKGDKTLAEEAFKSAATVDPSAPNPPYHLAQLYAADGKKDEAKRAYALAAKLGLPDAAKELKQLEAGK